MKDVGGHESHNIHVITSEEEVIIKLGVNNLDINQNSFTDYINRNIQKNSLGLYRAPIIRTKCGIGWFEGMGPKFLLGNGRHGTGRCPFISNVEMYYQILN